MREAPVGDQGQGLVLDPAGGVGLLLQRARAQVRAEHAGPAGHQLAKVEVDRCPGADPDDQQAAAGGQGVEVGREVGGADQLQDHVEGSVLERLGGVGDHRGAELGHGLVMAGVADAGHDPGPGGGAQLDGGRADPAGGAVDQQPVAEAEAGLGEQGVVGGGDDLGEPAGLGPAKLVGDRIAVRSWTTASSACPPPPTTAMTRSPGPKRKTPGPTAATSPASSSPGMSGGLPGGAG